MGQGTMRTMLVDDSDDDGDHDGGGKTPQVAYTDHLL